MAVYNSSQYGAVGEIGRQHVKVHTTSHLATHPIQA